MALGSCFTAREEIQQGKVKLSYLFPTASSLAAETPWRHRTIKWRKIGLCLTSSLVLLYHHVQVFIIGLASGFQVAVVSGRDAACMAQDGYSYFILQLRVLATTSPKESLLAWCEDHCHWKQGGETWALGVIPGKCISSWSSGPRFSKLTLWAFKEQIANISSPQMGYKSICVYPAVLWVIHREVSQHTWVKLIPSLHVSSAYVETACGWWEVWDLPTRITPLQDELCGSVAP